MDPILYNAVKEGNTRDVEFLLADYLKTDEENGYQVTSEGNTVLHVAALYGQSGFVGEVLKFTQTLPLPLLCQQNNKNETALHIAANEGHTEVVSVLLACAEDDNIKKKFMRMTDASGDIALQKAMRSQHLDVVKLLIKEDPQFEFSAIHAKQPEKPKQPDFSDIFHFSKKSIYAVGPSNRMPRQQAAIQEHVERIMDPILYNAAMEGNTGVADHLLADHLKRNEENGYRDTPKGNTVLHVAALHGQSGFVEEVLKFTPTLPLSCHRNNKKETALHLAANEGHTEVVCVLIRVAGEENYKEELMRMTDDNGDSALHKAVRTGCEDTVRLLVEKDPEFEFPQNNAGETPLYLAAESGSLNCLAKILQYCKRPTYDGPYGRNALHAAIIHKHTDCVTSLWKQNELYLCKESDEWGWNPLHYAVKQELKEVVSTMLGENKFLAYTRAGSGNDWTTSIHIAASEGYVNMINELLKHCPDCREMINSRGQNALHVAISNNKRRVVSFLLNCKECHNLIDEADNDGNTPLHLLAASNWLHVPSKLRGHPDTKKMLFNKENQTPLDVAMSGKETTQMEKQSFRRTLRHGRLGRRDLEIKRKKMQEPEDEVEARDNNTKSDKKDKFKDIMAATQIHLVVATLLVTVTFASGFTLPGGFESDPNGSNKGMAILIRKTAFRAFVVSNAIAFTCSAGAVFSYFFIAVNAAATKKLKIIRPLFQMAMFLQLFAMSAVVIAFVTGMYATLAHSVGLATSVCVIGCASFLVFTLLLRAFY